jgi:lysozyme
LFHENLRPGLRAHQAGRGLRLDAYRDGGGVPTIGYGSTLGVHMGMTITPGEAERRLMEDVERLDINPFLDGAATAQNQFDAMQSLAFNIGLGDPDHKPKPIAGFRTSSVLKFHRAGNYTRAAKSFLLWDRDNGREVQGLLNRREQERLLYLGEL